MKGQSQNYPTYLENDKLVERLQVSLGEDNAAGGDSQSSTAVCGEVQAAVENDYFCEE